MRSPLLMLSLILVNAAPGQEPSDARSFAGTWETTYGVMTLTQTGDTVRGTYTMGQETGEVEGKVEKGKLTFTYRETRAEGEGWFDLAPDGQSFKGQWRAKGTEAWQSWTGKRSRPPVKGFEGLWKTTFGMMRLVKEGDQVSGLYSYEAVASISGSVKDRRFTFAYKEPAAEGEGWFELGADGDSFKGEWKAKGSDTWAKWDGTRVAPKAGRKWLVVVEARWEESLADREYSFGDMLKTFFARLPNVEVRHRSFTDAKSLAKWCTEAAFLAEPVALCIATHGTPEGVTVGGETIGGKSIAQSLRYAKNLILLHFSSCLIMKDKISVDILKSLGREARFPISGYTTAVDWAASAVIEEMYLDLILARDLTPEQAARQLVRLMPFSGDKSVAEAPFPSAGFRLVRPDEVK